MEGLAKQVGLIMCYFKLHGRDSNSTLFCYNLIMKIKVTELEEVLQRSLTNRGLTQQEAQAVAEPFLEAQLRGKKTHGISKFLLIDDAINKREGKPEIVKDKFNYALIDAHKELGYLTAQFATDILIEKAKKFDNATVGVINSYYYSMAGIYARKVAKAGFVAIILNNGGPQGVVPYGSSQSLLGTNPIAIGIPTLKEPIVLDMATSEKTWGEINLAKVERRTLQENTFIDITGSFTTDPYKAEAIIPFGGVKGYGLNFMFEILTGALVGTKMGLASKNGYDLGFFFMAFSPDMFTTKEKFEEDVEQLIADVKNSPKLYDINEVYLPGEQSDNRLQDALQKNELEIDQNTWNSLIAFSNKEDVKTSQQLVE